LLRCPGRSPPVIINNNNPAPAPTVYVPVQPPAAPAAQSDPWSVAVAYTNDVNTPGGNSAAWTLLGPSVQAGWNSNYNTFACLADPTSFRNVNEISESGDTVTFTFDLHNGTELLSRPVDQDLLGSVFPAFLAGPLGKFAVDEGRSGADQGDEVGGR
jgi:hypothetical protein